MATIKRFEDLECWQEARKFVRLIYQISKNEMFLSKQIEPVEPI